MITQRKGISGPRVEPSGQKKDQEVEQTGKYGEKRIIPTGNKK